MNVEDMLIEDLELSTRLHNCLLNDNLKTIGDVLKISQAEMLRSPNFGKRCLEELKKVLFEHKVLWPSNKNGEKIQLTKEERSIETRRRWKKAYVLHQAGWDWSSIGKELEIPRLSARAMAKKYRKEHDIPDIPVPICWKPISTAPRNGTAFLGTKDFGFGIGWNHVANWQRYICVWHNPTSQFAACFSIAEGGELYPLNEKSFPSHWMALPEPPNV